MAPKPLDVLKKGLAKFSKHIKDCKDKLIAKVSQKEPISPADEEWLDQEANTIDEERLLDVLDEASDYERGVEQLDDKGKMMVRELREWAGDLVKVAGNKRKRTHFCMPQNIH